MIHPLIDLIIAELRDGFTGEFSNVNSKIVVGPVNPPNQGAQLPIIAVYPGPLEVAAMAREMSSSQPRPVEIREEIAVNGGSPSGPYPLAKTPLDGSALCKVIYNLDDVSERSQLLVLGTDYTIDESVPAISFNINIADASVFQLAYSYVGIFTIREFTQQFFVDIYEDDPLDANKWASVVLTILLTNHDELLEAFNTTQYQVNAYAASLSLSQFQWLEGDYQTEETIPMTRMVFHTRGQVKTIKEISSGFGLIEQVRSPGVVSGHPVDIEPDLE